MSSATRILAAGKVTRQANYISSYIVNVFSAPNGIPSAMWERMHRRLGEQAGITDELTNAESLAAIAAYNEDEAPRQRRFGSFLLGIGASLGLGGTVYGTVTQLSESTSMLGAIGGATVAILGVAGVVINAMSSQNDGVGQMVAAVLRERMKSGEIH